MLDGCAFHEWPSPGALAEYLDPAWRQAVLRPGDRGGPIGLKAQWLFSDPRGDHDPRSFPETGPPGSDPALTTRRLLGEAGLDSVVLGYREGILATALNNYLLSRVVTRAANRWTIERWLEADPRYRGLVLACGAVPETAAEDIREFGRHDGMVGVALGSNALGRGFGHAVYHPIYAAAAELGLPVVVQAGSDAISSLDATPTAGGLPATYAQYATHASHTMMGHVASMIMAGVFEKHPTLKVLCLGGGVAWLPAYAWRLDYWFKINAREAPWLTALPSEYLYRHVRVGTLSMESTREPGRLETALRTLPGIEDMIVYTSGYPAREWETPDAIAARLPAEWHGRVFHDNAAGLFPVRRPGAVRAPVRTEPRRV